MTKGESRATTLRASFQTFTLPRPEILLMLVWLIWVTLLFLIMVVPAFPYFEDYTVASPNFINSLSFHEDKIQQFGGGPKFPLALKFKEAFSLGAPKRRPLLMKLGFLSFLGTFTLFVLLLTYSHSIFLNILPILFILSTLIAISSPWLLSASIIGIYLLFVLCSTLTGG